jgi:putative tryptophan/tyrosine transport system substrate-binding protein
MNRRDLIALLGGAAVLPVAARAQQTAMPIIGYLDGGSADPSFRNAVAFRQGLREAGFIDGQNVRIEYRGAEDRTDRLPVLATDLVKLRVSVLFAAGGPASPLAAKTASAKIPIVFVTGADPVKLGLVASLNRPGGNVTGIVFLTNSLGAKRLGLLHELLPKASSVGLIVNPSNLNAESETKEVQAAADALGLRLIVVKASADSDLGSAFDSLVQQHADALLVAGDAFLGRHTGSIVALAQRHAIPAIYDRREYAADGGLMTYGTSLNDALRQGGIYTGRILKGADPADLPVLQPTKFEFVINLITAKMLGLTVPPRLLVAADEVIE